MSVSEFAWSTFLQGTTKIDFNASSSARSRTPIISKIFDQFSTEQDVFLLARVGPEISDRNRCGIAEGRKTFLIHAKAW